MFRIELRKILPKAFAGHEPVQSDLWLTEALFVKKERILINSESGSGKSSLCGYLLGFRKDFSGTILYDGEDISIFKEKDWLKIRKEQISVMLQDLRLFKDLTALENVVIKNRLTNWKTIQEIKELFVRLGIIDKLEQPVGKLSLGQQQRVAFIRSLCQPFNFLVLDEPVSHLDKQRVLAMSEIISEEIEKQSAALIVTSIGYHPELEYDKVVRL